jgi:hypothetical protein
MLPVRIVGNGLAAHVLAQTLLRKNIEVEVFGIDLPGSASQAAWGLLNPIHLKTRSLTYGANQFERSLKFYQWAETRLGQTFLKQVRLRHYYRDAQDAKDWMQAWQEILHHHVALQSDYVEVLRAGSVSIPTFIDASVRELKKWGMHRPEPVMESEMLASPKEQWVVWAHGHWAAKSTLFGWVPLRPSAGVQVEWELRDSRFQPLVQHRGYFYGQDPVNPQIYRLGSTYSWSIEASYQVEAEKELIHAMADYPGLQAEGNLHFRLGYRPASGDRKPILGPHPLFKNHLIFNGLGSKGLLMAPVMAELTADICVHSTHDIPPELDVRRFYKRYKPSP